MAIVFAHPVGGRRVALGQAMPAAGGSSDDED